VVTNKGDLRNLLKLNCGTNGLQTREELRAEGVPDYLIPHKVLVLPLGADMTLFVIMVGFSGNPFPVLV
jgi:hypothetical protein